MKIKYLAFAGIVVAGLTGCSQKESSTVAKNDSTSSTSQLQIVFIPKSTGSAYFDDVVKGFQDEAAVLHAKFTTTGPSEANATSQIPFIKEQIQKGVNVIVISASSPDALNSVLDEARSKGITVITVDADLTGNESHRDASVMSPDAHSIGVGLLDTLSSQLPTGGDFAILSSTPEATNQNAWIKEMQTALATPAYNKLKLVTTVYGNDDPTKSTTEAEGLFSKYPNLRGIIAPTSAGLPAVAQSLDTAGLYPGGKNAKNGGLILTGLCTPKAMMKFVDKGVVSKFQLWSPHDLGVMACYLADGIRSKKIKVADGVEVDVPGLGKHKFDSKGVITAGPMLTFDKSNVSKYNF